MFVTKIETGVTNTKKIKSAAGACYMIVFFQRHTNFAAAYEKYKEKARWLIKRDEVFKMKRVKDMQKEDYA